jgi:hypothetical protein
MNQPQTRSSAVADMRELNGIAIPAIAIKDFGFCNVYVVARPLDITAVHIAQKFRYGRYIR